MTPIPTSSSPPPPNTPHSTATFASSNMDESHGNTTNTPFHSNYPTPHSTSSHRQQGHPNFPPHHHHHHQDTSSIQYEMQSPSDFNMTISTMDKSHDREDEEDDSHFRGKNRMNHRHLSSYSPDHHRNDDHDGHHHHHLNERDVWDVEEARKSLRMAAEECRRRGLKLASQWAAEQLVGLPPASTTAGRTGDGSNSNHNGGELASPPGLRRSGSYDDGHYNHDHMTNTNNNTTIGDPHYDVTLYAKTLLDMGEYDRAALCLSRPLPGGGSGAGSANGGGSGRPPLLDISPNGIFLRAYALYLSGERRKEEEIVELRDPLERCTVTNANLPQLASELSSFHRSGKLDAFGIYVYGIVLKELQKQSPPPSVTSSAALISNLSISDHNNTNHNTTPNKNTSTKRSSASLHKHPFPPVQTMFIESILLFPYNWSAWLDLAEVCAENPTIHEEIELALQPLSHHWMYHFFLIHVFIEQQQNEQALLLIDRLVYSSPQQDATPDKDNNEQTSGTGLFVNSNFLKAMTAVAYYNMRDFDTSQDHFVDLCQRDPWRLEQMDIFSNILYVKESKAELSHLAHSAVKNDKYRPETCCIIGNYYSLKSQHEKAVQYFQRALKLDRTYLSAWTLMGHEFVEMKNTAAAIEAYRRAVDINPRDYRAWYGLGQTYEILNMLLYALFYYRKAAVLRPYDARMWCAMGGCYQSLDKKSDAIRAYERAVSNHDREGIATKKLATLYREEGQHEKAAKCYQRHVNLRMQAAGNGGEGEEGNFQIDAPEAEVLLYLAFYHKDNGNFDTAARMGSRLLEYPGPEKEEAKALLREIRSRVDNERAAGAQQGASGSTVGGGGGNRGGGAAGGRGGGGHRSFEFSP